ncbi:MAG TPA: cytochrome c maturation protein CcmE [Solirubrobacterales bacterium]|nr:cytochrome c maturation protein CcmE [Solirubrobacterales bacterium]
MDPQRKRKIRLVVALTTAVLLAAALVYTSFSASSEAKEPSQLIGAGPGSTYDMTGKVVPGSVHRKDGELLFRVVDREGGGPALPVSYRGTVPDPFRGGREIVLTGEKAEDGTFVGEPDTLVTKCPSKFTTNDS